MPQQITLKHGDNEVNSETVVSVEHNKVNGAGPFRLKRQTGKARTIILAVHSSNAVGIDVRLHNQLHSLQLDGA